MRTAITAYLVKNHESDFGSHTECPKCGQTILVRKYVPASDNQHFEEKIQEYIDVYCATCGFHIGQERTKDFVA